MPADSVAPSLFGRRLAGSLLYALLVTAVALPIAIWVAGLLAGPQVLRERLIITTTQFANHHGRAGLFAVMAATVLGLTLFNLLVGPRKRYAWNWGLGQPLMDDALGAREKLSAVFTSGWGCFLLALDLGWLVLLAFGY
jgi:hypothetical protein